MRGGCGGVVEEAAMCDGDRKAFASAATSANRCRGGHGPRVMQGKFLAERSANGDEHARRLIQIEEVREIGAGALIERGPVVSTVACRIANRAVGIFRLK